MNKAFPNIVAHNGYDNTPVNSIDSIISGIKRGADYIEIDVRVTNDNIPVLFHDEYLVTGEYGIINISDLSFTQINKIVKDDKTASSKYGTIETLEDAVITVKEHSGLLNLDMKDMKSIDSSVKIIKSHCMTDYSVFSGCEFSGASYLKNSYPEIQVMLNLPEYFLSDDKNHTQETASDICRMAASIPCCGININHIHLFDELLKTASLRYLPVSIWTLSEDENLDYFLKMKIFSITTTALKQTVEKRNMINNRDRVVFQ